MSQDDSLILGRLNARESSTLTIATVAASASLILLSLVIDRKLGTEYAWLYLVGIGFAILGIFYREVTFLSIDQAEYGLLTLHTQIMIRASSNWQRRARHLRHITVRFFLFVPVGAWLTFIGKFDGTGASSALLFLILLLVSMLFCSLDPKPTPSTEK